MFIDCEAKDVMFLVVSVRTSVRLNVQKITVTSLMNICVSAIRVLLQHGQSAFNDAEDL